MIIILEGLDRCGKSTISRLIQDRLYSISLKPVLCCHYTNIKSSKYDTQTISHAHYEGGFKLIQHSINDRHIIFDRFHLGEYVYAPIYRKYSGEYVYELEKKYQSFLHNVKLITLTDSGKNLLLRDDGLSHSIDIDKKEKERLLFIEAHNKSIIKNKLHIDLENKTESYIQTKVLDFIFGSTITIDFFDIEEQDDLDDNE